MEMLIATLFQWAHNSSVWLQTVTGMTIKDVALFAGGIVMVLGVLWLGIYSGKPRYREAARFGWFLVIVATIMLGYGLYHHNPVPGS